MSNYYLLFSILIILLLSLNFEINYDSNNINVVKTAKAQEDWMNCDETNELNGHFASTWCATCTYTDRMPYDASPDLCKKGDPQEN